MALPIPCSFGLGWDICHKLRVTFRFHHATENVFVGDNKDHENLIQYNTWGQGFDLDNDKI